jgi:hypothetical protein
MELKYDNVLQVILENIEISSQVKFLKIISIKDRDENNSAQYAFCRFCLI